MIDIAEDVHDFGNGAVGFCAVEQGYHLIDDLAGFVRSIVNGQE